MDLEAEIPVSMPQPGYLHESSTSLKLMGSGVNGVTPVTAVEEAAAAVVAAARAIPAFSEPVSVAPLAAGAANTTTTTAANTATNGSKLEPSKKPVRYRECLKNHAAGIGGHALDGCGEFMPSGEEGTIESLKCSACDCHRNFHRREVEGAKDAVKKKPSPVLPLQHHGSPVPSMTRSPGALVALSNSDQSDDHEGVHQQTTYSLSHHLIPSAIKKRFRTKFTNEQKEKMFHFAHRLGWKIQKHDEGEVQQFCADVGIKRHVLKVWMHNNKNTFVKKMS